MWGITFLFLSILGAAEPSDDAMRLQVDAHATGTGAAGRVAAMERAKRNAVEQVVKTLCSATDPHAFRPLLDRASNYVSSCELVEQKQNGAETEVTVEAYIRDKQLRRDVATLLLPLFPRPPKVVVILSMPAPGETTLTEIPDAESELVETFEQAGMEVVSPTSVRARCSANVIQERIHGDAAMAVRFARESLADVAVVGEATVVSEPAPKGSNVVPNRATVTLRIIRAEDAKITDMVTGEAVVKSRDTAEGCVMALSDACGKVRNDVLIATVLAMAGGSAPDTLVVTVDGVQDADQWRLLQEAMGREPGVQQVEELYFGEGSGRMRVKYEGALAPFVDGLAEESFGGFRLEPKQVIDRDITLAVVQ